MGLKQIIQRKKLYNPAIEYTLTIPFEPLIYSIKHDLIGRRLDLAFFRNKQWYSLLKCQFPSYTKKMIPVVLIIKFYVPPPIKCKVTKEEVKSEKIPAVEAPELTEYLLSFLEMLFNCLIRSYSQCVKIDMCKFYSAKPRTSFQFMKWSNYEELLFQSRHNPEAENVSKDRPVPQLQSERVRDGNHTKSNKGKNKRLTIEGPVDGYCAFPLAGAQIVQKTKKRTAKLLTALESSRRRQSREVSKRLLQRHSMGGRFTDFLDTPIQELD